MLVFLPQLSKPEKVAIPERYVELEPEEPLSTEELAARQRKAEKIKNILTKSRSVIFWSYAEVGVKHWNLTSYNSLVPVQFNYVRLLENAHRMYVLYLAYLKLLFKANRRIEFGYLRLMWGQLKHAFSWMWLPQAPVVS